VAYTLAQKQSLETAIASGATEVSYDGKRVQYRSLEEMRSLLADMETQLAGGVRRRRLLMTSPGHKDL
jgi:hypothetical protein